MKREINVEYLRIDEFTDVEASLESLLLALRHVAETPLLWKQIILSAHSALQGSCVCILTGTSGIGALSEKSTKAKIEYLNSGSDRAVAEANNLPLPEKVGYHEPQMASLRELLQRLPDTLSIKVDKDFDHCHTLETKDFWRLMHFRNELTHFKVVHWSIGTAGLPRIVIQALQLTNSIVTSSKWQRMNRFSGTKVESLIQECIKEARAFKDPTPTPLTKP